MGAFDDDEERKKKQNSTRRDQSISLFVCLFLSLARV